MLPEVTRKVRPPRALAVPYPLGYPLGMPNETETQRAILRAMLALCERTDVPVLLGEVPADATGNAYLR
jgi:D-proline reductase (dithiol) PrdB